jgi:hypothetical protein
MSTEKQKQYCGFHHEGNLQVLTKVANSAKHNRFPGDGIVISGSALEKESL